MEPLKNQFFNLPTFEKLTHHLEQHSKGLHQQKMLSDLMEDLDQYELKERLRNTTQVIHKHLSTNYKQQIEILWQVAPEFQGNFFGMVFPDFVELYGQHDLETSYKALAYFTQYSSSEFAIRPFFKLDFVQTLDKMLEWSKSDNFHIRRLASEGSRPRLPWSFQLKEVIENPEITLPILKNLKKDGKIYVKKSVANHLNDISKDHPDFLTKELSKWDQKNVHTKWVVKHALRTLIKKGNNDALEIIGVTKDVAVKVNSLTIDKSSVKLGEALTFTLTLTSLSSVSQHIVVDFAIHYVKSNGSTAPKVFKLKTFDLNPKETITLQKKIRLEDFSTRKHYSGQHQIEILMNGMKNKSIDFHLTC